VTFNDVCKTEMLLFQLDFRFKEDVLFSWEQTRHFSDFVENWWGLSLSY